MSDTRSYPQTEAQKASGDWNPTWDLFMELDPDYLEAFLAFRAVPQRNGPLEQKYKEMIFIAINAATTHLHGPGVRRHIQNALKAGATKAEILEVIQLTTIMGIHSMALAAPILQEEVAKLTVSTSEHSLPISASKIGSNAKAARPTQSARVDRSRSTL